MRVFKTNDQTSNLFTNGGQLNYKISEFNNELIETIQYKIKVKNNNDTYDWWLNNSC